MAVGGHPSLPNQRTVSPWESVAGGGPTQTFRHAAPQQARHAAPNQAPPPARGLLSTPFGASAVGAGCNRKTPPSAAAYHPNVMTQSAPPPPHRAVPINPYLRAPPPTVVNQPDVWAPQTGRRNLTTPPSAAVYEDRASPLSDPFANMSTEELERRLRLELEHRHQNKRLRAGPVHHCLDPEPPCMPPQGHAEDYDVMLPLDLDVLDNDAERVSKSS
jgi:hypothetical protein